MARPRTNKRVETHEKQQSVECCYTIVEYEVVRMIRPDMLPDFNWVNDYMNIQKADCH